MKITLPQITNGQDLTTLNSNFTAIATALNTQVLYRLNPIGESNTLGSDLDFNGHKLYNVSDVLINGISISSEATVAVAAATQAAASATTAIAQASNASNSASIATAAANTATATIGTSLLKANNLSDLSSISTAKVNLALVKGDVGLSNVDNTSDVNKPVSTAQATALALKADKSVALSQFASTTSAQLLNVLSDETGTGFAVFNNAPALTSPVITGGTINNASVGATTASTGAFTTLNASSNDALFYSNISTQAIANATATTVTGWTLVSDRLGTSFNAATGVFTAPATGRYLVSGQLGFAATAGSVGTVIQGIIVANAVAIVTGETLIESTTVFGHSVQMPSTVVSLTAGQTVVIQAFQNIGASRNLGNVATKTFLSIARLP